MSHRRFALLTFLAVLFAAMPAALAAQTARGVVFHDANENGVRDASEPGLAGVGVSNGREVVLTGNDGRYALPVTNDTILFVIKPRGYRPPLNEHNMPQFHYLHKPDGSPPNLRYRGVDPTGPLPESVDFPLIAQEEPDRFTALFFGDTQPRDRAEVEYIAHDVVADLVGADVAFGVTLGDIVFDDLGEMEPLAAVTGLVGAPWYHVHGNHDTNMDVEEDYLSDETHERIYGPPAFAFNYGPVHFIVLDDVHWDGDGYHGAFGARQLAFVRNTLAHVPEERLVVVLMHIPLFSVDDRDALFDILESRPHTFSAAAHTHNQRHLFYGAEDGWDGEEPHHHWVSVTACGSWWQGAHDERGIPHATMSDGAPNGYSFVTFDGNDYAIAYRAASRPAGYQMNIYAPEQVASADAANTLVKVNVFAGSSRSTVEMKLGGGEWVAMKQAPQHDPGFLKLKAYEEELKQRVPDPDREVFGRMLPGPYETDHIWEASLPASPPAGTHLLHVRTTDMFGQTHEDTRAIRVVE